MVANRGENNPNKKKQLTQKYCLTRKISVSVEKYTHQGYTRQTYRNVNSNTQKKNRYKNRTRRR